MSREELKLKAHLVTQRAEIKKAKAEGKELTMNHHVSNFSPKPDNGRKEIEADLRRYKQFFGTEEYKFEDLYKRIVPPELQTDAWQQEFHRRSQMAKDFELSKVSELTKGQDTGRSISTGHAILNGSLMDQE